MTKAAARQRRGRAGRTRPGQCYKLFTRSHESQMGDFPIPEILRVPLESLSLSIKVMRDDVDVVVSLSPFRLCSEWTADYRLDIRNSWGELLILLKLRLLRRLWIHWTNSVPLTLMGN